MKKIGCLAAALTLTLGCHQKGGSSEASATRSATPPSAADDHSFILSYWWGPPAAKNELATWQRVADAHFNLVGPTDSRYEPEQSKTMLALCAGLNLPAVVSDPRLGTSMAVNLDAAARAAEVVQDFAAFPNLFGYYVADEPSRDANEVLAAVVERLRELDPKHAPYINLFPNYADRSQLGSFTYEEYVHDFLQTVKPPLFSFDHYAFRLNGGDRPGYFANLEAIRDASLRFATPAWNIVLAEKFPGYRRPTEAELRFQVFTSLAYGMKGLVYFPYWPDTARGIVDGIVGPDGEPGPQYELIHRLNVVTLAFGRLLAPWESLGVYHSGAAPAGTTPLPETFPLRWPAETPFVTGLFVDPKEAVAGPRYALIVNRDTAAPQTVQVKTDGVKVDELTPADGSSHAVELVDDAFELTLQPGEGRLFRLVEPFTNDIAFDFSAAPSTLGWEAGHSVDDLRVEAGALQTRITGDDPYLVRAGLRIPVGLYDSLRLKLRMPKARTAQLFWQTSSQPFFSDDKHTDFALNGGDGVQDVTVPLNQILQWRAEPITALRLDPAVEASATGETFALFEMRGANGAGTAAAR